MSETRLPDFQPQSEWSLDQDAVGAPCTAKVANESTSLSRGESAINSSSTHPTTPIVQATSQIARPTIMRAIRSPAAPTKTASKSLSSTPGLSRPILNRSATATNVARIWETPAKPARLSLLRRTTIAVATSLSLSLQSAQWDEYQPKTPTYWADHIHRKALLQIWDKPSECIRDTGSIVEQLSTVQNEMLRQCAELGSGDVALTMKWIEHVLGLCLRHPFGTSRNAGRWQNLAMAGGPRGNWGPW